ncbi:hypothetical protein FB451DRAFT_1464453 [Mycena latifolia]|nr:hypothetical protein FB451DRAFT_1464453 [Mycena latifolia]
MEVDAEEGAAYSANRQWERAFQVSEEEQRRLIVRGPYGLDLSDSSLTRIYVLFPRTVPNHSARSHKPTRNIREASPEPLQARYLPTESALPSYLTITYTMSSEIRHPRAEARVKFWCPLPLFPVLYLAFVLVAEGHNPEALRFLSKQQSSSPREGEFLTPKGGRVLEREKNNGERDAGQIEERSGHMRVNQHDAATGIYGVAGCTRSANLVERVNLRQYVWVIKYEAVSHDPQAHGGTTPSRSKPRAHTHIGTISVEVNAYNTRIRDGAAVPSASLDPGLNRFNSLNQNLLANFTDLIRLNRARLA